MLEMPESWETCRGELLTGRGTSPRERSALQSTKLRGVGDLKNALTADVRLHLEFVQVVLSLALVQCLFAVLPFLRFGMVT